MIKLSLLALITLFLSCQSSSLKKKEERTEKKTEAQKETWLLWQDHLVASIPFSYLSEAKFLPHLTPGICEIWGEKGSKVQEVNLHSKAPYGYLYGIWHQKKEIFEGIGRINEEGKSICEGMGEFHEIRFLATNAQKEQEKWSVPSLSRLFFSSNEIPSGSLIRVALIPHAFYQWENLSSLDIFPYKPIRLDSSSFLATHVLKPTLLMPKSDFHLALPSGSFVVFILLPNGHSCLVHTLLAAGEEYPMRCFVTKEPSSLSWTDFTSYTPSSMDDLGNILKEAHMDFILSSSSKEDYILFSDFLKGNNYTLNIEDKESSIYFVNKKTLYQINLTNRNSHYSFIVDEVLKHHRYSRNLIASKTENEIISPFFVGTFSSLHKKEPWNYISNISNGARIFPLFNQDYSKIVKYPSQSLYEFKLLVPALNSSDKVSLYMNGKEFRRFVFNRGDLQAEKEYLLKFSYENREDFLISVVLWGTTFLPEFIMGKEGILPFSMTTPMCIDSNNDGNCSVLLN